MDCREAQERILDDVDGASVFEDRPEMMAHLAGCASCTKFAETQRTLHTRLASILSPPDLSPEFRAELRQRIRREPARLWPDSLPDIVHLASCGVATIICAALLPYHPAEVLAVGAGVTVVTYVIQSVIRTLFEVLEGGI
jgi:predicted anti-sigma-YlaC factor YlaD